MEHSFDIEIANKYGIESAIILKNIYFWIEKNKANNVHYHDGNYWTYNSVKAMKQLFPYMSPKKISNAVKKLVDDEIIVEGNYNNSPYDRTKWYALTEKGEMLINGINTDFPKRENRNSQKGKSIYQDEQIEFSEKKNGIVKNGEPIPDMNTYINTDINTYVKPYIRGKRFSPPTTEEVKAYCLERNNSVDAETFVDYYQSKGWMIGKNHMKDWKAAVRTWENKDKQKPKVGDTGVELDDEIDHSLDGIF